MSSEVQQALSRAAVTLLRPLVRVLLRNGMSYGVFAELARKVYVDVAFADFAQPGRKQTISRVSAMTGLTRKEVKRLSELPETGDASTHQRFNRAIRVLTGWLNDERFRDARGPAVLPVEGAGSFAELVKHYSGDVPTQAMLSVLEAAGTIEREGERVRLVKHAYVPAGDSIEKIRILGVDSGELIATIDHNLTADADALRFQRKVSYDSVPTPVAHAFQRLSARKSQVLLETFNAWLAEHENEPADDADPRKRVSVGIYYFEQDSTETGS